MGVGAGREKPLKRNSEGGKKKRGKKNSKGALGKTSRKVRRPLKETKRGKKVKKKVARNE